MEHKNKQISSLENALLSLRLQISNQEAIYRDSKEVSGVVKFTPKISMLNIPMDVSILGESQCVLYDQNFSLSNPNSHRIHQTEQQFVQKRNQLQKCLPSTLFSQNFHQYPQSTETAQKQIFLEGKQSLFQTIGQNNQKIKILSKQTQYTYQFTFFLPPNLPSTINSQFFDGVHLIVNYKISATIKINQKCFVFQNGQIPKSISTFFGQSLKIQKSFQIKRRVLDSNKQSLCNKVIFKYFHEDGQQVVSQCIEKFCILKYFYKKFTLRPLKYDIYHCQLLTSVSQFKIIHLTARIFIQPNKNHLDEKKVKTGKFYSPANFSKKPNTQNKKQQQLTISKIVDKHEGQLSVKIQRILVRMYGEIVGVRRIMMFERVMSLDRKMYDICEGEMIEEIPCSYFSEKNELFEMRFWFEIEPLEDGELSVEEGEQKDETKERIDKERDEDNKVQFEMTMSKLNDAFPPQDKQPKAFHSRQVQIRGQVRQSNLMYKLLSETNQLLI